MKNYEIQELGFDSWLELFKSLEKDRLINEDQVTLAWPKENREVKIKLCTVKARAFDEIYEQLPGEEAIEVIQELVKNCGSSLQRGDRLTIRAFLEKFPSRNLLIEQV